MFSSNLTKLLIVFSVFALSALAQEGEAGSESCELKQAGQKFGVFYEDAPLGQKITVLDLMADGKRRKRAGLTINQTEIAGRRNASESPHFFQLVVSFLGTPLDLNELFNSDLDFDRLPMDVNSEPLELRADQEFSVDYISLTLVDRTNDTPDVTKRLRFRITQYKCQGSNSGQIQLKPSTASMSSRHSKFVPENCIDGKWGLKSEGGGDFCHTRKHEAAPWFAIDYGDKSKVSVGKVVLENRADCCGDRTAAVEVRLSNELPEMSDDGKNMFTGGQLIATYAGPGDEGETIEIESNKGWENFIGRYLIIQMDKSEKPQFLNLQEVTGFGEQFE